ncbi:MAG: DUF6106 family protein [Lachnospiraceae bacterium]
MNETYAESLVKRKTPFYSNIIVGIMALITLYCIFLALTGGVLGVILMFLSGGATYLVHRNFNIEYEYLFVNAQLSIDKILGRSKRKKAWEGNMENFEIIAPSDHHTLKDYANQNRKKLDFSSQIPGAITYTIMYQAGAERLAVIIEPNEKIIKCFRQTAPRKVVQ